MFWNYESKLSFLRSFCNKFLVGELLTPPSPTVPKESQKSQSWKGDYCQISIIIRDKAAILGIEHCFVTFRQDHFYFNFFLQDKIAFISILSYKTKLSSFQYFVVINL